MKTKELELFAQLAMILPAPNECDLMNVPGTTTAGFQDGEGDKTGHCNTNTAPSTLLNNLQTERVRDI